VALSLSNIKNLKHIVTHAYCPDGTASALLLKQCLPWADVTFVQYNTEEHKTLPVREGTIFADFSPHDDQVEDFVRVGAVVLDHHITKKEVVEKFGKNGVFGDEKTEPGISGASLVFREVYKPLMESHRVSSQDIRKVQDFAYLVGIRDTWQNKHKRWNEACAVSEALNFWPWNTYKSLKDLESKLEIGPILLERKLNAAKKAGDDAWRFTTSRKTKVAVIEGVRMSSDTAEYLDDEVDLVIGFNVRAIDGKSTLIFSNRSHTFFDCAAFATKHGGGGHTRAAGFAWQLGPNDPQPHTLIRRIVEHYELTGERYNSKVPLWDRLRYLKWLHLQST
jgi:oligoribonuclease NrnB/cAMP/cGMP phosphodiesterase (DHH superfamily)